MHLAIPLGTALCGATLRLVEVTSCRIIWCVVQREHIVENRCDLLGFKCFQRLLSMQFIQNKSFWKFYCAFYKDILHFLNPNKTQENKINNWTKWQIFTWYLGVWFMSSFPILPSGHRECMVRRQGCSDSSSEWSGSWQSANREGRRPGRMVKPGGHGSPRGWHGIHEGGPPIPDRGESQ